MTAQTQTKDFFDQCITIFNQFKIADKKYGGLMTKAQAASILGVSHTHVVRLIKEKKLRETSVDDHWYVSADDVENYLENHRGKSGRPSLNQMELFAGMFDFKK